MLFNKYFYIAGIITSVGFYLYNYTKNYKKDNQKIEITDNFLNYFPITQEEIDESKKNNKDRDYKDFKDKIINYSVPNKGETYFYYDIEYELFNYWSNYELNYRELETITRKYCIEYDCKELYIDRKYEFKNKKELLQKFEEEEKKKSENENSVFVKFKDYNKKGTNSNVVILEETLKFKRKGKINDYNELIKNKNVNENTYNFKNSISYKNYKLSIK
jgi:hypothetical protein